jgi:hypothetical protein
MLKLALLCCLVGLGPCLLAACTEADRETMFSSDRAPLVGRCDPQPGYPPPQERPGCEYVQGGRTGHVH